MGEPFIPRWQKSKAREGRERGNANERGYTYRWQKARVRFLKKHPLCAKCEAEKRLTPSTIVDHKRPHRGDKKLFWDETNWQALCKTCHDRKTAAEDGGFGREQVKK